MAAEQSAQLGYEGVVTVLVVIAVVIIVAFLVMALLPFFVTGLIGNKPSQEPDVHEARLQLYRIRRRFDLAAFRLQTKVDAAAIRRSLRRDAMAIRRSNSALTKDRRS